MRACGLRGAHAQPDAAVQRKGAVRPRPRGAIDRIARGRRRGEGARGAQALPRAVRHHGREAGDRHRDRRLPRRQERRGLHQARRGARSATRDRRALRRARGGIDRARRRLRRSPARRHRRRSRRRLARTCRRPRHARAARPDAAARRPRLADISAKSLKKAEKSSSETLERTAGAQGVRGPHLLRRRRHLAGAGAAAHVADRLSAARHARLRHPGRRGAGVLPAGASRRRRDAVQDRSGRQRAAAAARLRGAGARTYRAHRQAAAGRVLGARRARRAALFAAQAEGQGEGRADRGRARSQSCCARARRSTAKS